jgi:hypothetical protein
MTANPIDEGRRIGDAGRLNRVRTIPPLPEISLRIFPVGLSLTSLARGEDI